MISTRDLIDLVERVRAARDESFTDSTLAYYYIARYLNEKLAEMAKYQSVLIQQIATEIDGGDDD